VARRLSLPLAALHWAELLVIPDASSATQVRGGEKREREFFSIHK